MATTQTISRPSEGSATSSGSEPVVRSSFAAEASGIFRSSLLWRYYLLTFSLIAIGVLIGGWWGFITAALLGAALLYWNIRSLLIPWGVVMRAAQTMSDGASHRPRFRATELDEGALSRLGQALNSISGNLSDRLRMIDEDRHRLETVLGATLEGVLAIDQKGVVTLMNLAAQRLLTVASDQSTGRPFAEVCRIPRLIDLAREAVADGELRTAELKSAGKVLEVYATPLASGNGTVLVIHDVTDVRRLESIRRDFVANVSHELKTPLTSIKGYVETLLDGGVEDVDNNLRFLKKIEVHVNRLATLITDLLSLSRIESGEAFNQRTRVDLADLLVGAYQRLAPIAEQKELDIRVHGTEMPVHIHADPEALHQILDNLIDNAIKYNKPGGSVDLYLRREAGPAPGRSRARIDVKDTGVGIPQEDLPRIFERFYRIDKARSRELGGTGLGLSIVKHLVQALDGEIHVESLEGSGSTFTVWLPEAD